MFLKLKVKVCFVPFRDLSNEAGEADDTGECFTSTLSLKLFIELTRLTLKGQFTPTYNYR